MFNTGASSGAIEGCHPEEEEVLCVYVLRCSNCEQQQCTHVRLLSAPTPMRLCAAPRALSRYIYYIYLRLGTQLAGAFPDDSPPSSPGPSFSEKGKTLSILEAGAAFLFVRAELLPLWSKIGGAANVMAESFFFRECLISATRGTRHG
jgi:hypothetical protein